MKYGRCIAIQFGLVEPAADDARDGQKCRGNMRKGTANAASTGSEPITASARGLNGTNHTAQLRCALATSRSIPIAIASVAVYAARYDIATWSDATAAPIKSRTIPHTPI